MVASRRKPELLAIVGPTASGKSALAIKVAKEYRGEIIAADSRTVYRGLDIGTAKPSQKDQQEVPHWGLDLVEPGERFNAYQFQEYALKGISDIKKRGRLPILVGGTGLYIDSVLLGFGFRPSNPHKRAKLESLSEAELRELIVEKGYQMPKNFKNHRHLIRALETGGQAPTSSPQLLEKTLIIGLTPPDAILRKSIANRAEEMFKKGVIDETNRLFPALDESELASAGIIYRLCARVLNQEISNKEAIELFKMADWQYARRQRTWFRRNKFIHWFSDPDSAHHYIKAALNN